jgi:hypothetical protein
MPSGRTHFLVAVPGRVALIFTAWTAILVVVAEERAKMIARALQEAAIVVAVAIASVARPLAVIVTPSVAIAVVAISSCHLGPPFPGEIQLGLELTQTNGPSRRPFQRPEVFWRAQPSGWRKVGSFDQAPDPAWNIFARRRSG